LGIGLLNAILDQSWAGNRVLRTGTTTTCLYPFKCYSVASSTGTGAKYATTTDYVFNGDTVVYISNIERTMPACGSLMASLAGAVEPRDDAGGRRIDGTGSGRSLWFF
jgi:hypothetical protein